MKYLSGSGHHYASDRSINRFIPVTKIVKARVRYDAQSEMYEMRLLYFLENGDVVWAVEWEIDDETIEYLQNRTKFLYVWTSHKPLEKGVRKFVPKRSTKYLPHRSQRDAADDYVPMTPEEIMQEVL